MPILISVTICPPLLQCQMIYHLLSLKSKTSVVFLLQQNFSSIFISFSLFFFNTKWLSAELLYMAICVITMTLTELAACRLVTGFCSPNIIGSFAIDFNRCRTGPLGNAWLLDNSKHWRELTLVYWQQLVSFLIQNLLIGLTSTLFCEMILYRWMQFSTIK